MELWLLLPTNIHGQHVDTLSLDSSLEISNRKFACPLEKVTLTCSISGLLLQWEIQEANTHPDVVGIFGQTDSVGNGFFEQNHFSSCHGEIISSGVLEYIDPGVNTSIYNSSMIIRPTSLNVSSDCDPLEIICKSIGQGAETNTKNVTYKIASEL